MKKLKFIALIGTVIMCTQAFAVDYICVQNVSKITFNSNTTMNNGTFATQNQLQSTVPANSGSNWGEYCLGINSVNPDGGVSVATVTLSGYTPDGKSRSVNIVFHDPWIGAANIDSITVTPSNTLKTRAISPGGDRWVAKICDPEAASC